MDDLGSGLLTDKLPWPEPAFPPDDEASSVSNAEEDFPTNPDTWDEPTVEDSVAAGADLTLFSGDKLLGGPQAGLLLGRADLIAALRKNPLARTFRPGKLTLAGLEATLRLYRDPAIVVRRIPAYRMLSQSQADLEQVAKRLAQSIAEAVAEAEITGKMDFSEAGGGSLATQPFPTWVVVVRLQNKPADTMASALRQRGLPIICRIHDDALVFDPRTLTAEDVEQIPAALAEAVREIDS